MTVRVGLVMLILAASALSACSTTDSASRTSSPRLTRLTTIQPEGTSSSARHTTTTTTTKTTDSEALAELLAHRAPSGNVGCIIDPQFVRCDITERDWTPPPRPIDCEFDYGQGVSMAAGEQSEFVCAGDTTLGGGDPLEYGHSVSAGPLSCDSAETGITCRDSSTGHGFTIAHEAYQRF